MKKLNAIVGGVLLAGALAFAALPALAQNLNYTGSGTFGGQLIGGGTVTNDNAAAGVVGEVMTSSCPSNATTATITVTIAAPGVVTWTAHGFTTACPVVFTTSGALPTGITSGTTYWIVPSSITANTFTLATSVANALAGTPLTTTGTQSGTQTGTAGAPLTTATAANITGLALTAGDWDCRATVQRVITSTTSFTIATGSISQTSATVGSLSAGSEVVYATAANVPGQTIGPTSAVVPFRESVAALTNVFLVASDTFTASTNNAFGALTCRRAR